MKKLLLLLCVGFSCVTVLAAQEIDNKVRDAVNTLASKLVRQWEVSIGEILDEKTGEPGDLSRYLYYTISDYAAQNSKHFRVSGLTRAPKKQGEPEKAIITGNFFQMGDNVRINLYLVSDLNNRIIAPATFYIPVVQLNQNGIAINPENKPENSKSQELIKAIDEIAVTPGPGSQAKNTQSENSSTQKINIQAWFDSVSRTYLYRDELKMSVMADKDCYFKIIHIDADNKIKMIYPNSQDRNNELKANMSRSIFETASYMLYDPYGAETILVIASAQQFENIEREYITPWTAATPESVRAAVSGGRGGDHEPRAMPITQTGEGAARYTITILKPNEEYEYGRPENMVETVQAIRNDASRQGGEFGIDNNETSGYYILNGVRGSYRIPRNAPDTVQFAFYNLDKYSGIANAKGQTRGAGFIFSFEKPGNISQTIQTVRAGIESKGGTFTGNEQQGSFKASGIAGQYRVADLVNVTITDKPVLIPNSMIEKEVKNFFGGR